VVALGILIATAFTFAIALVAWRFLRFGRPALDVAMLGFLWVFFVTLDLLLHGLAGELTGRALTVSSLIGLLLLGLVPATRASLIGGAQTIRGWIPALRSAWTSFPAWLRVLTCLCLIVWAARFLFLVWALPPFVWDSLTYHLTNVAHWIQSARIEIFDTPVLRIYSPANYEVFATWFAVFQRHDGWIEVSGLPAYAIILVSVYALARRIGLSRSGAWVASLGMASTPAIVLAATGTKNDPLVAAVFLCMTAIVVDMGLDVAEQRESVQWTRWTALVLLFLYALGTKPYILHLMPGLVVLGFLLAGWRGSGRYLRTLPGRLRRELAPWRWSQWLALLALLAAAVLLGLYWYGRNEALQGNPFFPYGVSVGGAQVEASPGVTFHLDLPTLVDNLQLSIQKFGDKQGRIAPDLPNTTGWGWVAYGMGLPALAWALVRRRVFLALTIGFLVAGGVLLLSSPTSPWNMRYMIWVPALLCVAVGAAYDGLFRSSRTAAAFVLLLVGCLSLNFSTTVDYNLVKPDELKAMLGRPFSDRQAAYLRVHVPYEYENALINVPPDAILGYNVHANGFVYPLYRADFSQRLAYVRIEPDESCGQVADAMRAAGTRYLMGAPEQTDDAILLLLHRCGEEGSILRELGAGLYVLKQES
jgi:hypothetical protein